MKKKVLVLGALLFSISSVCAHADILGEESGGWSTYMGADTYFHNVQFTSDSVGKQNEYYVEYTPNSEAVPVVINGKSIWGTRTIKEAEQYMRNNGLRPLVGINADYFSFKTGIPMGYTIIDGEIVSKEFGGQDAIGFREDGTGFIKWLDIQTTLSNGEKQIDIMYINKWLQPGFDPVYMLNDKFGSSSKTNSECIFVICSPVEGRIHVDEEMKLRVDDVFIYTGAIEIPEGKQVFAMDVHGNAECYDFLSRLYAGQELILRNQAMGDDGTWKTALNAVSSVGGRLISNGTVNSDFEAGAAPRTAVGIKADGNIIFYTLDGRQSGHSYGAQLKTLAKRMAELGCVEAINLDGGGSTVISALFPGNDQSMVVNSPSDGYLRNVANFIFLKDNRERTGIPWIINLNDAGNTNYISGMDASMTITSAYDTANYKMEPPYNDLHFRVDTDTDSTIDDDGNLHLEGEGVVNAVVYGSNGDLISRVYTVYETPEEIKIYNQADWKEVTGIYTHADEEMQLSLSAASFVNGVELNSNNRMYTWEIEGDIGTVTPDGIFTLGNTENTSGRILITAGNMTKEIPVEIGSYPVANPFYDTENHWARDIISTMAAEGILNGQQEDGMMVFKPDNNMTRAEFASMIVNYMQLDISKYANEPLSFVDAYNIPQWAQGAIKAAYKEGIILGRVNDDGTVAFAPYENITRAEAMTILGKIVPQKDNLAELPFADSGDVPSWAQNGAKLLYSMGIVNGYEGNVILPNSNIKRAEAATMLYKIENR
ncbi:MAG: S-layer homology domain-containing protein [Oscillospiraceae bacterium]|nr:S-layer homology domain-containing protein [Oscillospiraceae bacterium]